MISRKLAMLSMSTLMAGVALASCSNWSYSPSMRGNMYSEGLNRGAAGGSAPKAPTTFTQSLASEYSGLSNEVASTPTTGAPGDWDDADYFSRKSLKAQSGEAVQPENNANWLIPLEGGYGFRTQLADARTRLVKALDAGGRSETPALAAHAQSRYDCWVWSMERDWKTGANSKCRADFLAALDEMENPPRAGSTTPREYNVYFDFNKSKLTPEARQIIDSAAGAVQGDGVAKLDLLGKADRVGTDAYNMSLSERRADAVRDALAADGIPSDRIDVNWVGEREPPVPTADGVRESRNRVVTITVPTAAPAARTAPIPPSATEVRVPTGTFLHAPGPKTPDNTVGGDASHPNIW